MAIASSIGGPAYTAGVHTDKNCSILPEKENYRSHGPGGKLNIRTTIAAFGYIGGSAE